jgi:hypothetical protein
VPACKATFIRVDRVEGRILLIRDQKVILDFDLVELYDVPAKRVSEQFRRNMARVPPDRGRPRLASE